MAMFRVFISHSHKDTALADALKALLGGVFTDDLTVDYSSDRAASGGIEAGSDWLDWILQTVKASSACIVMLTPESLARTWLMWESGAVTGVALAVDAHTPIVPLLYRVSAEQIPGPLRSRQSEYGDAADGIERVLQVLHARIGQPPEKYFTLAMRDQVPRYLTRVGDALKARPMALSEAAVQEWCERLDDVGAQKRYAEVAYLHAALLRVFTAAEQKEAVPLDVRLHRRLGQLYLDARQAGPAATEFELALRLMPNDIFLMYKLAFAQLEAGDAASAMRSVSAIERIDPQVLAWHPDVAGLKARILREEWQRTGSVESLRAARDAYWQVMQSRPDAYYAADNAGQLSLLLGEVAQGETAFRAAIAAVTRLGEHNLWSEATLATACLALRRTDEGLRRLRAIRVMDPPPRDLQSILGGLERLRAALKLPDDDFARWKQVLTEG